MTGSSTARQSSEARQLMRQRTTPAAGRSVPATTTAAGRSAIVRRRRRRPRRRTATPTARAGRTILPRHARVGGRAQRDPEQDGEQHGVERVAGRADHEHERARPEQLDPEGRGARDRRERQAEARRRCASPPRRAAPAGRRQPAAGRARRPISRDQRSATPPTKRLRGGGGDERPAYADRLHQHESGERDPERAAQGVEQVQPPEARAHVSPRALEERERERHRGAEQDGRGQQHQRREQDAAGGLDGPGDGGARDERAVRPGQRAQQRQRDEGGRADGQLDAGVVAQRVRGSAGAPRARCRWRARPGRRRAPTPRRRWCCRRSARTSASTATRRRAPRRPRGRPGEGARGRRGRAWLRRSVSWRRANLADLGGLGRPDVRLRDRPHTWATDAERDPVARRPPRAPSSGTLPADEEEASDRERILAFVRRHAEPVRSRHRGGPPDRLRDHRLGRRPSRPAAPPPQARSLAPAGGTRRPGRDERRGGRAARGLRGDRHPRPGSARDGRAAARRRRPRDPGARRRAGARAPRPPLPGRRPGRRRGSRRISGSCTRSAGWVGTRRRRSAWTTACCARSRRRGRSWSATDVRCRFGTLVDEVLQDLARPQLEPGELDGDAVRVLRRLLARLGDAHDAGGQADLAAPGDRHHLHHDLLPDREARTLVIRNAPVALTSASPTMCSRPSTDSTAARPNGSLRRRARTGPADTAAASFAMTLSLKATPDGRLSKAGATRVGRAKYSSCLHFGGKRRCGDRLDGVSDAAVPESGQPVPRGRSKRVADRDWRDVRAAAMRAEAPRGTLA